MIFFSIEASDLSSNLIDCISQFNRTANFNILTEELEKNIPQVTFFSFYSKKLD